MSYVRFGGNSAVYIYEDIGGFLRCCGCCLGVYGVGFDTPLRSRMIAHVEEHHAAEHAVPAFVIERLRSELEAEGDDIREERRT